MCGIQSAILFCFSYSVCNFIGFLCNSCFGGRGSTGGRRRSVLLLSLSIIFSLYFQYFFTPALFKSNSSSWWWYVMKKFPGLGSRIRTAWLLGYCAERSGSDTIHHQRCVGYVGVYRPTLIAFLFFAITAIVSPLRNRSVASSYASSLSWPMKYSLFLVLILVSIFVPNEPVFNGGVYYAIFRTGAMCFIVLQQIILIDIAYNWNEAWLDRANEYDAIAWGSGIKWLRAIVAACIILYSASITGIIALYHYFGTSGCFENNAVITLTWIGILAVTAIQLYTAEGSLLTSSVVSTYVTYLAYSIVSKNPRGECNPALGRSDTWGIIIGLSLTMISLAWTGYSWTADDRLSSQGIPQSRAVRSTHPSRNEIDLVNAGEMLDEPFLPRGLALDPAVNSNSNHSFIWKMNAILCIVTCWVAASLTAWGYIEITVSDEDGTFAAANPQVGRINMTMIGVSQWIAILLYGWSLVAPYLFPDYDFSSA